MGLDQTIDITADQHETILTLLKRYLPNTPVWVYGSRVKWTANPQSDLDMVVFATPEQNLHVSNLREAFEESNLPFPVDLFVWDGVPEAFRRQIESEHVVLVKGEKVSTKTHWRLATVEDISEKVAMGPFGSSIKVSTFVPEGVPIISGQHLHGIRVDDSPGFNFITHEHAQRLSNANVKRGDVIFTHAGNIGQVAYIPAKSKFDRYVISQRQFYMRCDQSKVIPEFIALFFKSPEGQHQLLANAAQVGVPSIAQPVSYLRTIEIPLPPIPEQRSIAHILSTLDDKIELNRQMNETLETMARALFKSWFVDFDPVRAKMEGRDTGLSKDIAGFFPDRMVDSELGGIPEGWTAGTISDMASLNPESWKSSRPPVSVTYVDITNAKWGCIEKTETYAWEEAPSRARRVLRKNDTIVATVRPGNGSFTLIDEDGLTGSTGFAVLRPQKIYDREFVWCAATSSDNIARLAHLADGGAYPALRPNVVLETPVVLADHATRRIFSTITARLVDRMEDNKRESRILTSLRDTLLPKLISGEIRVSEAEQSVEAVT